MVFDPPGSSYQIRGVLKCVVPGGKGRHARRYL